MKASGTSKASATSNGSIAIGTGGSALPPKPRRPGCCRARRSIARSRVTAMAARRSCGKTIQRRSARASVVSIAVVSIGLDLAEPEKHAIAPYAELLLARDPLLMAKLGQFVEDRPREAGFEARAHQDIGRGGPVLSGFDAQRVIRSRRHNLVEIGPEDQLLIAARALHFDLDRDEGRVLDHDAAAFGGGHQPVAAVGFAAQYGGEQLDQGDAVDRRAPIIPGAVAGDPHVEVAELDGPARTRRSSGRIARGWVFHQS